MKQEFRRERWNLRAEALERQRDEVTDRIRHDPQILVDAFVKTGGNWLKAAQLLALLCPVYWTNDESPASMLDHDCTIARITELAELAAPQLLDYRFVSALALEPRVTNTK